MTDPERVTLTERIKALLDEHLVGLRWWAAGSSRVHGYCSGCPWESESEDFRAEHRAHVAELIARDFAERESQIRARVETLAALYEVAGQMRTQQSWRAIAAEVRALSHPLDTEEGS